MATLSRNSHIIKAYDEELRYLHDLVVSMGHMAADEMILAIQALVEQSKTLAFQVVTGDQQVDNIAGQVNTLTMRLLALRSPLADDLRAVISAMRIAIELERVADLAVSIAKRIIFFNIFPLLPQVHSIAHMGAGVINSLEDIIKAFIKNNVRDALLVWKRDVDIDNQCSALFRELLAHMMEDSHNIAACSHLMFIAKNIERAGDHATNIAEIIHYRVRGETLRTRRPKGG